MINPNRILLLLIVYAGIGFIVVATATTAATSVNSKNRAETTCVAGSDQPHCNDPSYEHNDNGEATETQQQQHVDASKASRRGYKSPRENSVEDGTTRRVCASGDNTCVSKTPSKVSTPSRFKAGDIIELYNAESKDIQIVFPSIVKGIDPSAGYHVTKTTDGKEVKNLPEKFLHKYVPYSVGDEVLCNIGEFKKARPIIVRCTVIEYEPAAKRGAMVLQGKYSVQVHPTKANEEYTTSLPVWKLQRRYRAGATMA